VKYIAFLLFLLLWLAMPLPAEAAFCRHSKSHDICILDIKRSAKNYWEYRAAVKVDEVERPIEVYNCRDRTRTRQDGIVVPFEPNGAGEVICQLFKQK
jgi:hypothetical protein